MSSSKVFKANVSMTGFARCPLYPKSRHRIVPKADILERDKWRGKLRRGWKLWFSSDAPLIPATRSRERVSRSGSAHSEVVMPEVMKVSEVVVPKVMKASEVVMSEVMKVSEVVMVPEMMKVIHRVGGQRRWRGKHRHDD